MVIVHSMENNFCNLGYIKVFVLVKTFRFLTILVLIFCFIFALSSIHNETLIIALISVFMMLFGNLSPKVI